MFFYNDSPPQDYGEAYEDFELGTEAGSDFSLYGLGLYYQEGRIVNKDESTSVEYYRQAAEMGNRNANYAFAQCYYNGDGIEKSIDKAQEYYTLAAEQGYTHAQANLGWLLYNQGSYSDALNYFIEVSYNDEASPNDKSRSQYGVG